GGQQEGHVFAAIEHPERHDATRGGHRGTHRADLAERQGCQLRPGRSRLERLGRQRQLAPQGLRPLSRRTPRDAGAVAGHVHVRHRPGPHDVVPLFRLRHRQCRQRVAAERARDGDDAALPDVDDHPAHDHDEQQHDDHHDADRVRGNGRACLPGERLERHAVRPYRRHGVHRARPRGVSRLPRRAPPTMAVIEPHWPENPYTPYVGTVDIIGVDRYPCSYVSGCVFSKIDDTLALLDQAGVPHYWAFIQAFADSYYRMPTADELHE